MTTPIKVEQVDELAAASVNPAIVGFGGATGYRYLCEAFAKARIAAEAKTREEDARIAARYLGGDPTLARGLADAIRSRMETDNGR